MNKDMIFNENNLYDTQITSIKLYEQEINKELMDLTGNDCSIESSTDIFIPNKKYNINKTLMNKFDSDLTLELGSVEINKDISNSVLGIDKSRFPGGKTSNFFMVGMGVLCLIKSRLINGKFSNVKRSV